VKIKFSQAKASLYMNQTEYPYLNKPWGLAPGGGGLEASLEFFDIFRPPVEPPASGRGRLVPADTLISGNWAKSTLTKKNLTEP